jgi:hypothetical protein
LFTALGSTADSSRLFFIRLHYQNSVYVGQLEDNGTRLANPRRFSFEQWTNWPTGWSSDGQTVFFNSDREEHEDIFQQPVVGRDVLALATGTDERRDGRLSPDGRWLLYLSWPMQQGKPGTGRLTRARMEGGPVQAVFPVAGYSKRVRTDPLVSVSAEGYPAFRCPSMPVAPCVLSEEIQDQVVFTAFDPLEGRKAELARIAASSLNFWDLSPDGRWIAFGKNEETDGQIHLLSVAGEPSRDIRAGGWTHLMSVAWASDGKARHKCCIAGSSTWKTR